jgi:hypothetical protein
LEGEGFWPSWIGRDPARDKLRDSSDAVHVLVLAVKLHMLDADETAEGNVQSHLGQTCCFLLIDIKIIPVPGTAVVAPSASAVASNS